MRGQRPRFSQDKLQVLFWLVLIAGLMLRLWRIADIPYGLNQDEASMGYDAWSILNYGIDRNGTALPVHMISWGCGQNALYAYLSMPFIALFGLNTLSIRLVSGLLGSLTLPAVYFLLKPFTSRRTALVAMGLLTISPWHIMLSRWGLEANILPAMFTFACFFLLKARKRPVFFILSSVLFALALYSYGPSYCVIPIFFCAAFFFCWFKERLDRRFLLAGGTCFVLLAVPIGLFILTNFFHLGDIRIGPFTAPELTGEARLQTALVEGTLEESLKALRDNVLFQDDWTSWNTISSYGVYYLISLPFTIFGIIRSWTKRTPLTWLLTTWVAASIPLFFLMNQTNINRVNIIFIPLILFAGLGLDEVMEQDIKRIFAMMAVYAVLFTSFYADYLEEYTKGINGAFYTDFGEAIEKAVEVSKEDDTIYLTIEVNMPYIFALFYTQTPTQEFLDTRVIKEYDVEFQQVESFGRFVCNTDQLEYGSPGTYVIPSYHAENYAPRADRVYFLEHYIVLVLE